MPQPKKCRHAAAWTRLFAGLTLVAALAACGKSSTTSASPDSGELSSPSGVSSVQPGSNAASSALASSSGAPGSSEGSPGSSAGFPGSAVASSSTGNVVLPDAASYFLLNGIEQSITFTCTAVKDPMTQDSLVGFVGYGVPSASLSTNVLSGTQLIPSPTAGIVCTVGGGDGTLGWHSNYPGSSGECTMTVEGGKRIFVAHVIAAQPTDPSGVKAEYHLRHECP